MIQIITFRAVGEPIPKPPPQIVTSPCKRCWALRHGGPDQKCHICRGKGVTTFAYSRRPMRGGKKTNLLDLWKAEIKREAHNAAIGVELPLEAPIAVCVTFYLPRPKSHFDSKGVLKAKSPTFSTTKPDTDNLIKAVLDALEDAGTLENDSRVAFQVACKTYNPHGQKPGALIAVYGSPAWPKEFYHASLWTDRAWIRRQAAGGHEHGLLDGGLGADEPVASRGDPAGGSQAQ